MNKKNYIIGMVGLLIVLLPIGCVEKFEADISDLVTEGLVVEGDIISDSTVQFRLSKTLPLTETDDNKVQFDDFLNVEANLAVKGSDGTSWTGITRGKGMYEVEIGTLMPEVEYSVEIQYKGDTYQSEPQKPLGMVDIERVSFSQPDLAGPVSILLDTEEAKDTQYFLWYFEEDWEIRAHFQTKDLYDSESNSVIHYKYPPVAQGWCYNALDDIMLGTTESNISNKIVGKKIQSIANIDPRISFLYSIRIQQRNLSKQEYEYYQVRTKLNNEMGGLFTPQPSELPTNITCSNPTRKVIGYVGCNMGIAKSHLYIKEDEVLYLENYTCDVGKDPEGSYADKFAAGFQISDNTEMGIEWASVKCVDVRLFKADPMGRPDWWPNPYLYYKE